MPSYQKWGQWEPLEPPGLYACAPPKGCGDMLNINHPDVNRSFVAYCHGIGQPLQYPLTDKQRYTFEVDYITAHGIDHQTPEWVRFKYYQYKEVAEGLRNHIKGA